MAAVTYVAAKQRISRAGKPEDIFEEGREAKTYYALANAVHPDMVAEEDRIEANALMAKLGNLWAQHNGKVEPITIKTKRGDHPLGGLIARGHIANVYSSGPNVVKMPRSPADNDLMEREAKALKKLDAEADPQFRIYAPKLVETFRHRDASRVERRCNVIERLDGFHTLSQVKDAYPDGLDPRDLAWIWRRLFVAIGLAADNGLVHGGVTPDNVMVHPIDHGVVLLDWVLSADMSTDQKIPAIDPAWPLFAHEDITSKVAPTPRIDSYMMGRTMTWMLGRHRHAMRFRGFAMGCMVASPPPAAQLLGEFDELLADVYGKRRYRKLEMPSPS
jgi:serine/threonine protein kinase